MLAEGIVPGLGGILIFIPQIALLFAFIAVLEETGYMSRVVFLMDKLMKPFGLSGKSVVPLISGVACAIPAVMAARNIENWKERMITIMVTPLMTCSARLPVYIILVALVVPETTYSGFNLQGLVLLALYMLGFVGALVVAWIFKQLMKSGTKSFLVMELPLYRLPRWQNVGMVMLEKSRTFVFEAGKIIMAISLILWVLATYGPADRMSKAESVVQEQLPGQSMDDKDFRSAVSAYKLENSYVAMLGKSIEPIIQPLGFDWKIGIALITSFAAREVFVSTVATIYSVGEDADDIRTIKEKMAAEINPVTGARVYTPATGFSLLVFYAFAMQCMSTLAIVYRETKSIKWPLIQLGYMTVLAYLSAFLTFQLISSIP
jgi:ferrous iron transport protein B